MSWVVIVPWGVFPPPPPSWGYIGVSFFINNHLGGSAALVPGGADLCGDVGVNCGSFITAALLYYRYYPIPDREEGGRGGRDSPALWSVPQVTWPDHVRGGEGPDSYQKNISIVLHVRYILRWTSNVERGSYLEYIFPLMKSTSIIAVICKSTVQDAVLLDSMGTFPNAIVIPVYCTWPKWLCNAQTCG